MVNIGQIEHTQNTHTHLLRSKSLFGRQASDDEKEEYYYIYSQN